MHFGFDHKDELWQALKSKWDGPSLHTMQYRFTYKGPLLHAIFAFKQDTLYFKYFLKLLEDWTNILFHNINNWYK